MIIANVDFYEQLILAYYYLLENFPEKKICPISKIINCEEIDEKFINDVIAQDPKLSGNAVEVYKAMPAGIGEHSDVTEAIIAELDKMAAAQDRIDMIEKYFTKTNPYQKPISE